MLDAFQGKPNAAESGFSAVGADGSGITQAQVCIRLIIAREIVGVAIISFVSTGAICKAVWSRRRGMGCQ